MGKNIRGFIKATTSFGGDDYYKFAEFFNEENSRAFEQWLSVQPKKKSGVVYRGYTFCSEYWSDANVKVGDIITEDTMTQSSELPAFTPHLLRASKYISEMGEGVGFDNSKKVLFEVHLKGLYMVDVSKHSVYDEEKEYRCVRGSRFYVKAIIQRVVKRVVCEEI